MKLALLLTTLFASVALSAPLAPRCDDGCRSLEILNGNELASPDVTGSGNPTFEGNGSPNLEGNGNPSAEGNGNGNGNPVAEGNGNPEGNGNGNGDDSANDNDPVGALGSVLGLGKNE